MDLYCHVRCCQVLLGAVRCCQVLLGAVLYSDTFCNEAACFEHPLITAHSKNLQASRRYASTTSEIFIEQVWCLCDRTMHKQKHTVPYACQI